MHVWLQPALDVAAVLAQRQSSLKPELSVVIAGIPCVSLSLSQSARFHAYFLAHLPALKLLLRVPLLQLVAYACLALPRLQGMWTPASPP